jgi:hypothetical protein
MRLTAYSCPSSEKFAFHAAGLLDEQLHRWILHHGILLERGRVGQPLHFHQPFRWQVEPLARSDQQFHRGAFLQNIQQQGFGVFAHSQIRSQQRLEVIQHEQDFLIREVFEQQFARRALRRKRVAHRVRNRGDQQFGRLDGVGGFHAAQRKKSHTVPKPLHLHPRRADRKARLAHAARSHQREDAALRLAKQFADLREFRFTPKKRRQVLRQVVAESEADFRGEDLDGDFDSTLRADSPSASLTSPRLILSYRAFVSADGSTPNSSSRCFLHTSN